MKFLALLITLVAFLKPSYGQTGEVTNDEEGCLDCNTMTVLGALRLRLSPTPTELTETEAALVLGDLGMVISSHFRDKNIDGVHSGLFRAMQFNEPSKIMFEPGSGSDTDGTRNLMQTPSSTKPTTILDITGIQVSFMDTSPVESVVRTNLQEYINRLDFSGEYEVDSPGVSSPRMQILSNKQSAKNLSTFDSFTLTWENEGYTLAPNVGPTGPPTGVGLIRPNKNNVTYPVLSSGLVVIVLASLFFAQKYRRNKGDHLQNEGNSSPNRRRLWSTSRHDEYDGLEWMHDGRGAFPTFDSSDRANIKVTVVDYENQPANPKEIGMINVNDSDSEVSSLGKSEGRMEVTCPAYLSPSAMEAFPVTTNLTRVNGFAGDNELYHETMEGFDRLEGECWVSDKGSAKHLQGLLSSNSDSLRYSSDSSQDVDGFFPTSEFNAGLGRRGNDTSAEEDAAYVCRPVELIAPSRIVGRKRNSPESTEGSSNKDLQVLSFEGDDHSSVGDILRSIV